jgi:hypothetical protein
MMLTSLLLSMMVELPSGVLMMPSLLQMGHMPIYGDLGATNFRDYCEYPADANDLQ